jgi:hypothetical protein
MTPSPPDARPLQSLGYELLEWYAEKLRIPSGMSIGAPLVATDEQARFVIRFYAVDDSGRFIYRRAALMRAKGWGKSPLLAAMALGELCGPVVFDGWDADGLPVGRPHPSPWVQIAAVSEDQTDNTYVALLEMLEGGSPLVDEVALDPGLTRIYFEDRAGRLEPVTAAAGSREGQPITFAVLDETHLWTPTNGGKKLAQTLRRNVGKMGGRSVDSTNAYAPGEDSIAEGVHAAASAKGVLFDSGPKVPKVKDLSNREQMMPALRVAYGDSTWVDLERIFEEANDPETGEGNARRFYLTQIVSVSGQWCTPDAWKPLRGINPAPKTPITLGFDGSRFHDATGLVGCTPDGHVFVLGKWEKPLDPEQARGWEVPAGEVDAAVHDAFRRFRVVRFYADPPYWQSEIAAWCSAYGDAVHEWWTNRDTQMARAVGQAGTMIKTASLTHDGDEMLARHVANARKRKVRVKWEDDAEEAYVLEKERKGSPRKIDLAVAMVLALEARADAEIAGEFKPRRSRVLVAH